MLQRSLFRLAVAATASVLFLGGCASLTQDDPRQPYQSEHWWVLGSQNPSQAAWPAASAPDLKPMPVESIPVRVDSTYINNRSPNWPPGLE